MALLALTAMWVATVVLVRNERARADQDARDSAAELVATYEAQVVRAVREIDSTLKLVEYVYEHEEGKVDLARLREHGLLPPDLVFIVSVADHDGNIVASTKPLPLTNVAHREYFQEPLLLSKRDDLAVGLPRQDEESGEWVLRFSRSLKSPAGLFDGIAIVSVAADFFVSDYNETKLGRAGVLGVVGTDGVFRVRSTGGALAYGDLIDFVTALPDAGRSSIRSWLGPNPWDGVRRYSAAHLIYDAPLAVVVGLDEGERLSQAERQGRIYYWRAAAGSVALLVIMTALGRSSWRLAANRKEVYKGQVEHARQVEHLAYHDRLTGLANRYLFTKLLHGAIEQARRHQRTLAVLFLDLDGFKHINDTLGHDAGDQLLREVARRLEACLRAGDVVARLGGDEFVVLLPELNDGAYAATVAQKIISSIAKPFVLAAQNFRVTGSLGIAVSPQDGVDEKTLTQHADIAMYAAKEQGKNNFRFYAESMNTDSLERLSLEAGLRTALEREEFELHYQAKRDLATGRVTGMEALLRWRHPELGMVAPMRFIPLAEQTGLIVPIGKWVMNEACSQNMAWQREGLPRLGMAVNLTARQFFDAHLIADAALALETTGMDADLLELEITEGMLLHDIARTRRILTALKALGVRVAIDDFGVGYSSLASLQRFPIDTVKIDRTLIREMGNTAEERALAEAIIATGKALSLTVVAQGVETKEQADFLRDHACDQLQGFYVTRPLPAALFAEILRTQTRSPQLASLNAYAPAKSA
jgi:diguanylate cyclase (GGDEF)-like protein